MATVCTHRNQDLLFLQKVPCKCRHDQQHLKFQVRNSATKGAILLSHCWKITSAERRCSRPSLHFTPWHSDTIDDKLGKIRNSPATAGLQAQRPASTHLEKLEHGKVAVQLENARKAAASEEDETLKAPAWGGPGECQRLAAHLTQAAKP